MIRWLFLPALVLMPLCAAAQLRTYLNLEAGNHWSLVKVDDPGAYFEAASVRASIGGLTLEQEIAEFLSIATGFYLQPYKTGINMKDERRFQNRLDSYSSILIPLRLRYRIQPSDFPVAFIPHAGYVFSINRGNEDPALQNSILSVPDGPALAIQQQVSSQSPAGHLLEMGASLKFTYSRSWSAFLSVSYLTGVLSQDATSLELGYDDLQGNSRLATYTTRGNGFFATAGLQAPLSHIWQNKDYRVRARIERGTFQGKGLERKGQLYVGGSVGSLWRLFYSSQPAIAARPMEERGLFRYANLYTGIYAGYMLSDELGLDLGVSYQGSNSFYAVMYDHEVDFAGKSSAPMYLDVPLRLRYYYNAWKGKLFAVVYGGGSLLTHFSGGSYAGPAGSITYTDPVSQSERTGDVSALAERQGRVRLLLRMGFGTEYRLPTKFPLFTTLYLNYHKGFRAMEQVLVSTPVEEIPEATPLVYGGSGWLLDIGVRIPMGFDDRQDCVRLTGRNR
jgi:hypothetical protein